MTRTYHYQSQNATTWDLDLGNTAVRLANDKAYEECAEHLTVGSGTVIIDDPAGTVGYSADAIVGLKTFYFIDDAMAAGNQRVYTGYVGERKYRRRPGSSLITGPAREIEVALQDLNAAANFRLITGTDGNRPAETVAARMTWLLGTAYISGIADKGYVVYDTTSMDAHDYRGYKAGDVLGDMAIAAHFNVFVYWDEATSTPALWFDDPNTSTAYSSTIKCSNVFADIDNATVFYPLVDAELARDPSRVVSGVYIAHSKGAVYRTRPATANQFAWRDGTAPNTANATDATASAIGDRFLKENKIEDDRLVWKMKLPPAAVNLIRAGQRMQVKFSHLPGYETYTWVRILKRTVSLTEQTDAFYDVALEASPQETFNCTGSSNLITASTIVIDPRALWHEGGAQSWKDNDGSGSNVASATDQPQLKDLIAGVGNGLAHASGYGLTIGQTYYDGFKIDLGASCRVTKVPVAGSGTLGWIANGGGTPIVQYSTDGSTWTDAVGSWSAIPSPPYTSFWSTNGQQFVLTSTTEARYWFVGIRFLPMGGNGSYPSIGVSEIEIWGCNNG